MSTVSKLDKKLVAGNAISGFRDYFHGWLGIKINQHSTQRRVNIICFNPWYYLQQQHPKDNFEKNFNVLQFDRISPCRRVRWMWIEAAACRSCGWRMRPQVPRELNLGSELLAALVALQRRLTVVVERALVGRLVDVKSEKWNEFCNDFCFRIFLKLNNQLVDG